VVDLPEHSPVAGVRGGALLTAWMEQGLTDTVVLGRWHPGRVEPVSTLDAVAIPSRPSYTIDQYHLGLTYYRGDMLTGMNGAVGFTTNYLQIDQQRIRPTQASYYYTSIVSAGSRIYLPDTNGWRQVMSTSDGPHDTYSKGRMPMRQMDVRGYDPNRGEYLVALKSTDTYTPSSIHQIILHGISDTGSAPGWMLDTLGGAMAGGALIPLDYRQALHISHDTLAIRLTGGKKADTFMLPPTLHGAAYMRLLGPRFLRWYWGDSLKTLLRLDLFDLNGALLAEGRITIYPTSRQVSVVESRYDSAIAVVHADSTGIHATLFDEMLAVVGADEVISSTRTSTGTPSAAFLRDTLCALWTDTRNGGYDIYGGMLAGARKSGVREREERSVTSARVVPAPARDRATLHLELRTGGHLMVDLFDMRGTLVRTERLEVHGGVVAHELALDAVSPGLYLLRYRIGDDAGWLPLHVVR